MTDDADALSNGNYLRLVVACVTSIRGSIIRVGAGSLSPTVTLKKTRQGNCCRRGVGCIARLSQFIARFDVTANSLREQSLMAVEAVLVRTVHYISPGNKTSAGKQSNRRLLTIIASPTRVIGWQRSIHSTRHFTSYKCIPQSVLITTYNIFSKKLPVRLARVAAIRK